MLISCLAFGASALADYYVSPSGDDAADGLSQQSAWQTISRVNTVDLNPGDQVFFQGGQTFVGNLILDASDAGSSGSPVIITSYGTGRATIDGGDGTGISVTDSGGIEIRELNFVGSGPVTNTGYGIDFFTDVTNGSKFEHIRIDQVDTSGFRRSGIAIRSDHSSLPGYRDVQITGCKSFDNGDAGIKVGGYYNNSTPALSHENLLISDCEVYNNFGDPAKLNGHTGSGMIVSAVDGAIIEYCESHHNGGINSQNSGGPVGIWTWQSNNVVIRSNISHHNKTGGSQDGGGFDIDGGASNTLIEYNLSYENEGAGYLLAQFGGAPAFRNHVIRYNISYNDGRRNGNGGFLIWSDFGTSISNVDIYGNTVYLKLPPTGLPRPVRVYNGSYSNIKIRNNVFMTESGLQLMRANGNLSSGQIHFQGNVYWTTDESFEVEMNGNFYNSLAAWQGTGQEMMSNQPVGMNEDPQLLSPGNPQLLTDPHTLATLSAYLSQPGSPVIDAGLDLQLLFGVNPGPRDFYGVSLPQGAGLDIGAAESAGVGPQAQCTDGLDNDGDDLTDFPEDPGCASTLDDDESNDPVPPDITIQPENQSVTEPDAATFDVTASGDTPLFYEWRRNGVVVSGTSLFSAPGAIIAAAGGSLSAGFEASGAVWHENLARLFVVDDGGTIAEMDADGGNVLAWAVGSSDLEGISVADPASEFIYLGVERSPVSIQEFNVTSGQVTRTFNLETWMSGFANEGLEALTFVPDNSHPEGGLFYAGLQADGRIFAFSLPVKTSSTSTVVTHVETITPEIGLTDISGLDYDTGDGVLYAIFDSADRLVAMRTDGSTMKEWELPGGSQEGFAVTSANDSIITMDSGEVWSYPLGDISRTQHVVDPTSVANDNGAAFDVKVSNNVGSVASTSATLTVLAPAQCADGDDNDFDGQIDFPNDPGCTDEFDDDETDPLLAQCADDIDNDGDDLIDFPSDPGCTDALDDDETDPPLLAQCADGLDNDSDGQTDFPDDPGCADALDDDESNLGVLDPWVVDGSYTNQDATFNVSAGTNRIVLVALSAEKNGSGPISVASVTLGNQLLTEVFNFTVGSSTAYHNLHWVGYLLESDIASLSGSGLTIIYSNTPSNPFDQAKIHYASYENIDQLVPIADSASNTSTNASSLQLSSTLSADAGDQIVAFNVLGQHHNPGLSTAGYGEQTQVIGANNGHSSATYGRAVTTAVTENPTFTSSTSTRMAVSALVLNQATVDPFPDNTPPTVAVTPPTSNPTGSSPMSLTGTAGDNVGVTNVTWVNDRGGQGTASGTDSWSVASITLQSGDNRITVTATDAAGNSATDVVTVTYTPADVAPPNVTINSPTSSVSYSTDVATLSLGGTASDDTSVTSVTWVNDRSGQGTASGTDNWSVASIALQGGDNQITVTATDAAGNSATDVLTVTYTLPDTTAPVQAANTVSSVSVGGTDSITDIELRYSDQQPASSINYTVTVAPVNGQLELIGSPGTAISSFTQADIDAGNLVYVHDGTATTSDSFTFNVDDSLGHVLGSEAFSITVTVAATVVTPLDDWAVGGTFTVSTGTDRLVLIFVSAEKNGSGPMDIGSVFLGSHQLTEFLDFTVGSSSAYHNLHWVGYLLESQIAALDGSAITVNYDNAPSNPFDQPKIHHASYVFVDQTTPFADWGSNTSTNASSLQLSSPLNVSTGNQVVAFNVLGQHHNPGLTTAGYSEQTQEIGANNGHASATYEHPVTTSGTESPTFTSSTSTRMAVSAIVIQ